MPFPFADVINSRLFKFIVGEDADDGVASEFHIHEAALTALSEPLRNLLTGKLIEAQAGCTKWPDVKKTTFERFIQFAYTGDYSIPTSYRTHPTKRHKKSKDTVNDTQVITSSRKKGTKSKWSEELESDITEEPASSEGHWGWGSASRTVEKLDQSLPPRPGVYSTHQPPSARHIDFNSLSYTLINPRTHYLDSCEPQTEFFPKEIYNDVLLSHATLYVLADYWIIDDLKTLTLYKLHKTLCTFKLNDCNASDILKLTRFAYKEEGRGSEGGIGGLRDLVCRFIVLNAVTLTANDGFIELIREGGNFAEDLWTYQIQRNRY